MSKKIHNWHDMRATHALLFFSFVIIGSAILFVAKKTNITSFGLVAISFGLMSTYAFFIALVPATKLRLDIAADNMYYLGFLYTLTSLAVAITISDPEKILGNFGVAITSTILGIAARVAFNQMRVDPHDVEAASRVELSEATRRVSSELNETILQLSKFRTLSLQAMAEGYEDVQKHVENTAENIFLSLKETSDKNATVLIELGHSSALAQEKLSDSILNLKLSNEELVLANKIMVSRIVATSEAFQVLADRYSDTNILEGKIINEVKESVGELQSNILTETRINSTNLQKVLEEQVIHDVKESMGELQSNILSEARTNSTNLQKILEDKVIHEVKESLGDLQNDISNKTQIFSKKLQQSKDENSDFSTRILEIEKIINSDKKNSKNSLSGSKILRWLRRG
tara:strand:+ start:2872 stop:4077 length:1206 start_codon:yes stop_codon:yes gene_type:complete